MIVFTASHPSYANTILDYFDPRGELIQARFYRDSCHSTIDRVHIKDLRIFDRPLEEMVIVDNASHSFGFQADNGIPMLPFFDDTDDREMIHLFHFLMSIRNAPDLRVPLARTFQMCNVSEPGFCEAIEGVVEYTILEIEESEEECPPGFLDFSEPPE